MPEPLLFLKSMGAAALASTVFVLAVVWTRSLVGAAQSSLTQSSSTPSPSTWLNSACVLATGFGLTVGCVVTSLQVAWPPASALDRFLTIVVPAVLGVELIAGFERVPRPVAWLFRMGLAAVVPRVLLHGSVYLNAAPGGRTAWESFAPLVLGGILLAGDWGLMFRLSRRGPGASIPLAFSLTMLSAGVTVMLAGYIKGGAAAFPLAGAIAATIVTAGMTANRSGTPVRSVLPAMLGIGVVGSFSLLFIGCFFGRLSTGCALVILLAPLLCGVMALPVLRDWNPWIAGSLGLVLVCIPLAVVLVQAKRNFDRDMGPLLGTIQTREARRGDRVAASQSCQRPRFRQAATESRVARCREKNHDVNTMIHPRNAASISSVNATATADDEIRSLSRNKKWAENPATMGDSHARTAAQMRPNTAAIAASSPPTETPALTIQAAAGSRPTIPTLRAPASASSRSAWR
jgi:hypothetical protein